MNSLQTLATVALGRMAITSMILAISKAGVAVGSVHIPLAKVAVLVVQRATVCGQAALTCSMDIGMQHEHRHATWAWAWTCDMDMDIQHDHGKAAWARACSMGTGLQHEHGHAAWTWACNMDMGMQNGHGHATWIWACSMDMQHGIGPLYHRSAAYCFSQNFSFYFYSGPPTSCHSQRFYRFCVSGQPWLPSWWGKLKMWASYIGCQAKNWAQLWPFQKHFAVVSLFLQWIDIDSYIFFLFRCALFDSVHVINVSGGLCAQMGINSGPPSQLVPAMVSPLPIG